MANQMGTMRNRNEGIPGMGSAETENRPKNEGNFGDRAKELTGAAAEKVKDAAASATQKAGEFAANVGHKAQDATSAVGSGMQSLAGTIRDKAPQSGVIGNVSTSVAEGLESGGRYLEEQGLNGIGDDLTNLVRRNPVPALLLGIGLGYLLAQATRRS